MRSIQDGRPGDDDVSAMAVMMTICLAVVVVAIVIPLAGLGVALVVGAAGALVLLAGHSRLHGRGGHR